MRLTVVTIGLACLAGCAAPSASLLREQSRTQVAKLRNPPEVAAGCVARNIEAQFPGYVADFRKGASPGTYELIARVSVGTGLPLIMTVADFENAAPGSAATFYFQKITVDSGVTDLLTKATAGC